MGASSSATNMKKIGHMKRAAVSRGIPLVFLGESSGARLPDNMGARGMGSLLAQDPQQYLRGRESPVGLGGARTLLRLVDLVLRACPISTSCAKARSSRCRARFSLRSR